MTQREAIERVCKVVSLAWSAIDPCASTASDCFCHAAKFVNDDYRNEGKAIEFVERVVREAITKLTGESK